MAQSIGLLDHFSALKDPREQWRVLYPLREVLLLLLCGHGRDAFLRSGPIACTQLSLRPFRAAAQFISFAHDAAPARRRTASLPASGLITGIIL